MKPIQMSADTAAYDRLFSKQANFTTASIGLNTFPSTTGSNGQILTSNGAGSLSWTSPVGTGSVTSVAIASPSTIFTATGGPITSAGTITLAYSGFALPIANGGTSSTTATGSGPVVLQVDPVLGQRVRVPLVQGTGEAGDLSIYSDRNLSLTGSNVSANGRRLDLSNYATYGGAAPMPEAPTTYKPGNGLIQSTGTLLAYNASNGTFTNNTGSTVLVTASYSCRRDSNSFGGTSFGFELNGAGVRIGRSDVAALDWTSGSAMFQLGNGEFFSLVSTQSSGSGNNYFSECRLFYTFVKN